MRWSWLDFEATPKPVIDKLLEMIQQEHEEQAREKQLRDLKARFKTR